MRCSHSTILGFAVMFAIGLTGCETSRPVSTMQDAQTVSGDPSQIQDRAVPMDKSRYMAAPRVTGPRVPIPPRGGTMNFSCNTTSCSCHGDADCNNMFSSNVCGRSAECNTGSGECSCLRTQ